LPGWRHVFNVGDYRLCGWHVGCGVRNYLFWSCWRSNVVEHVRLGCGWRTSYCVHGVHRH